MKDSLKDEVTDFNKATPSAIKRTESMIEVEEVNPHISNAKKMQAQIRMVVQTTYPEAQVGNSRNESIFNAKDFGFGDGETYDENRVAWIDVPIGSTVEGVQAKMDGFPEARIYRILSLTPTLTNEQVRAMENGFSKYVDEDGVEKPIDMNFYMNKQRIPSPAEDVDFADFKGLPQYRTTFFSSDGKEDIDTREEEYATYRNEESFKLDEAPTKEEIAAKVKSNEF